MNTIDTTMRSAGVGRQLLSGLVFLAIGIANVGFVWLLVHRADSFKDFSKDFATMYAGTRIAFMGKSPYEKFDESNVPHIHNIEPGTAIVPFYYPPQSLCLFAPFCLAPWPAASWLWLALLTLLAVVSVLAMKDNSQLIATHTFSGFLPVIATLLVVFNPVMQSYFMLGQTSLITAGMAILGYWALSRQQPWLGNRSNTLIGIVIWSFAAIKPPLAIPLVVLMLPLKGWRHFVALSAVVLAINILATLMFFGISVTLIDYIRFLGTSNIYENPYYDVANDQIISWNRLLFVVTGGQIHFNLSIASMMACYMVFLLAFWLSFRYLHGTKADRVHPAIYFAAAALAALLCSQARGYDLTLLIMLLPLIVSLGYHRNYGALAALFVPLLIMMIPRGAVSRSVEIGGLSKWGTELLMSYRAFGVLALSVVVFWLPPSLR